MNKILEDEIRYWLQEACNMGERGFSTDTEDWVEFENEAILQLQI